MPTVDDLTISLTIKDNSNLDKLRKNVEALMKTGVIGGTGGAGGKVQEEIKKQITKIKATLNHMDSQMNFLLPTVSPRAKDVVAQKEYARRVSGGIEMFKSRMADFLSPERIGDRESLAKNLNVENTIEGIQEGVEGLLDKYDTIVQSIAKGKGILSGGKAKKFLDLVRSVINDILSGGSNLTRISEIEKAIPEQLVQTVMERMMDKLNIMKKGQFGMTKVGKGMEDKSVVDWIKDVPPEIVEKLKVLFKGKSVYSGLMYAMKELNYKPEQLGKLFENVDEIKDDAGIQNLIKGMLMLKQMGELDFLAIPTAFQKIIKLATGVNVRAEGEHSQTRLDIQILGGDVSKLREIIPNLSKESEDLLNDMGLLSLELKGFLGAGKLGSTELQKKIYGEENLKIIASFITPAIRATLDQWGVEYFTLSNMQDLMVKSGVATPLETQDELRKSMGDLLQKIDMDRIEKMLGIIVDKSKGDLTLDQIKTILGPVSDMWDYLQSKKPLPGQ